MDHGRFPAFAFAAFLAPVAIVGAAAGHEYQRVVPLITTSETILGQPLAYPTEGTPQIQSAIVTLLPGEETGMHSHPYPTYGFVLDGELTVSYPGGVSKLFRKGEAVMDAVNALHNGKNNGSEPMRVLVVFMGVEGKANTILSKED